MCNFVALETSKPNSTSCHVFWIMSRVTVSMADVNISCRCWIYLTFSAYTMFLMYPHRKESVERDLGFEVASVLVRSFQSRHQGIFHLKRQSQSNWNGELQKLPFKMFFTNAWGSMLTRFSWSRKSNLMTDQNMSNLPLSCSSLLMKTKPSYDAFVFRTRQHFIWMGVLIDTTATFEEHSSRMRFTSMFEVHQKWKSGVGFCTIVLFVPSSLVRAPLWGLSVSIYWTVRVSTDWNLRKRNCK